MRRRTSRASGSRSRATIPGREAPAVVEHVRRLVNEAVGEAIRLGEVVERHEAGGFRAEPDDPRRVRGGELGTETAEVEVREIPRGVEPRAVEQDALDVVEREEDDGAIEHAE